MDTPIQTATYTIHNGDTIQSISKKFITTPEELMILNGNIPLIIQPQRKLKVPIAPNLYVTKRGDSVNDLLIRFKLTPEELVQLNPELILAHGMAIRIKDKF